MKKIKKKLKKKIKGNNTGEYSYVANYKNIENGSGYEIMYHISTLLPFFPDDLQQVERKRHLGNDVVNLIFNDGSLLFDPSSIVTNFTRSFSIFIYFLLIYFYLFIFYINFIFHSFLSLFLFFNFLLIDFI